MKISQEYLKTIDDVGEEKHQVQATRFQHSADIQSSITA